MIVKKDTRRRGTLWTDMVLRVYYRSCRDRIGFDHPTHSAFFAGRNGGWCCDVVWCRGFAKPWLDVVYGVMGSDLWIWLVLVCGFFGSLVALFEASGGIQGFTYLAEKLCKGPKRTLFATWLLGIVVFVDVGCPSYPLEMPCGEQQIGTGSPERCLPM